MKYLCNIPISSRRSHAKSRFSALLCSVVALATIHTSSVFAAGTEAGTAITNKATVTYTTGGSTVTEDSNEVQITVQELINANLVIQHTGDIIISSPQTEAPIKLTLTNTGNGDEAFNLSQSNVTGSDDFDVTTGSFYLDDGDGVFEPGTEDVLYSAAELAPDAAITLWAVSAIPDSLADNSSADIVLKAISKTFEDAGQSNPQPGDSVSGAGTSGTDAVAGTSGGVLLQTATYRVSAISVSIVKSITGARDNLGQGGSQYVPGAEVDYRLTVSVTGTGTATDVSVSDPLPDELLLKNTVNGEITVGGVVMTARANAIDGDAAYYDANTNTISVDLGDMDAGDAIDIDFTTVIQ